MDNPGSPCGHVGEPGGTIDDEYARTAVKELDEFARGAIFGFLSGWVLGLGLLWAIMEPLK